MDEIASPAAEMLRDRRGAQRVTFADVADHLEDYRRQRPEDAAAIDRFATFLAAVEGIRHDHEESAGSSITSA